MNYKEIHLINNAIFIPLNECRNNKFYPREEIAHPIKLKNIVEDDTLVWKIHTYMNDTFYATWLPWFRHYRFYNNTISTESIYILTERPALFESFKNIIHNYKSNKIEFINKLKDWLSRWWNAPFLVTIPILYNDGNLYTIENLYPFTKTKLNDYHKEDYLNVLLNNRSYTICNGLTLFLAYHRLGLISANIALPILTNFIHRNDPFILQDVTDVWHNIYYGMAIPHIADFPAYYVCTGPDFAHENIVKLFKPYFDFNFVYTNIAELFNLYTSPFTAMFPYFNPCIWKQLYEINRWPIMTPNTNDMIIPDMSGFIHGMLTTKQSWKYWCNNYNEILLLIKLNYISNEKLVEDLVFICSYFYIYGSHYYTRSIKLKTRKMFNMILNVLDNDKIYIPSIIFRYLLKFQMTDRLRNIGYPELTLINDIPYGFLKDIFMSYRDVLHPYIKIDYYIISRNIDVIRTIYPDIILSQYKLLNNDQIINDNTIVNNELPNNINETLNDNDNEENIIINRYSLRRSIIQIFRESRNNSSLNIFYANYVHRQIIQRLCAIYTGFGLYIDKENSNTTATLYNSHNLGSIIIEYLKKNKELLLN
jgi:hypothetical protein